MSMTTIGAAIYDGIENNEYLNECMIIFCTIMV